MTSVALVTAGLALGSREVAPYFSSGFSVEERFAVLADGDVFPGVSRFGRDMYLDECASTALGSYAAFQPAERRQLVLDNCLVQARALQAVAPLDAKVWMVSSELEAVRGNLDAAVAATRRARETAPHIIAYTIRRLNLIDTYSAQAPALLEGRSDDLASLFYSPSGIDFLADLYARSPDDRDTLVTLADKQAADLQQQFLNAVRNKAGSL